MRRIGSISFIFVVLAAFALAGLMAAFMYMKSLPSIAQLEAYEPTLTSQIVSSDDVIIKTFGAYKYKKISFDQIPDNIKKAIIATEDKNFYKHSGFDIQALVRSAITNIKAGKIVQGASTITQQITRILFLSQEKTFIRKFKELVIAYRLEKTISKDKILEMYLNNIYLGEGAYGIAAAADIYFDKKVQDLNLQECALLAGLPQAPSVYNPYRNMELARKRRSMVIMRMLEEGFITEEQAKQADESEIVLSSNRKVNTLKKAPYFVDFVMKELKEKVNIDEQEVIQGGYKIYTTLNYKYQKAAQKSVTANVDGWGLTESDEQAALLSYDVVSGQVMAYVGGRDYSQSQFDRVSLSVRQPGSSFKVFVYTTAMEQGMTPFTVYPDVPFRIGDWSPQNYGRKYRIELPLYKALALSSNVVAAKLTVDIGVPEIVRTARKMGITTPIEKDPTIALGSSGVRMIELATAYGVLANGGIKVEPYGIERIETANGRIVYVANNNYKRVLDIKTVAYMVEMLKQVVKFGTGVASNIGRPSAGKTGTTDSYRDAWFVGFTPDIVTAVWVGKDNNTPTKKRLTGGSLPAVIWRDYMKMVTADRPPMDFMYPEIIVDTSYEPGIHEDELEEVIKEHQDEEKETEKGLTEEQEVEIHEEFNPVPIPVKKVRVKNSKPVPLPKKKGKRALDMSGF